MPTPPLSPPRSDIAITRGGAIPGSAGVAAFTHGAPRGRGLPVLIAVPHAGRAYPESLLARLRDARHAQLRLEDRHVDRLALEIARQTGAGLLVAHAPRAMLDLNRAADDIDWDMIEGGRPLRPRGAVGRSLDQPDPHGSGTHRARSGLGLVPRRLPGSGEIWQGRLPLADLAARIETIHCAYHTFLAAELERLRAEWGAALLVDLHSMPPLSESEGEQPPPAIVLGDRFGAACEPALIACAQQVLETCRIPAARNRPYSGGYVLDRHGAPERGVHAMQIEVCRASYLDAALEEPGAGLAAMARALALLVKSLASETVRLGARRGSRAGEGWLNAAE